MESSRTRFLLFRGPECRDVNIAASSVAVFIVRVQIWLQKSEIVGHLHRDAHQQDMPEVQCGNIVVAGTLAIISQRWTVLCVPGPPMWRATPCNVLSQ